MNTTVEPDRIMQLAETLRQVGAPLLNAIYEDNGQNDGAQRGARLGDFPALASAVGHFARDLSTHIGVTPESLPHIRWGLAGLAAQFVTHHYRQNMEAPQAEQINPLVEVIDQISESFRDVFVGDVADGMGDLAAYRANMLEALVPAIGAVSQYSFGRGEYTLLAEVAERVVKAADKITRSLVEPGVNAFQWRYLCWSIIKCGGQIYADAHFAEADRLLYMKPEERTAYFAQHGNVVPMTHVWQEFNQRMSLLATLGAYLEAPAGE